MTIQGKNVGPKDVNFFSKVCIATLLFLSLGYGQSVVFAGPLPEIWLAPLDASHTPTKRGSADYLQLFSKDEQWKNVSEHIKVFKIYHFFVMTSTELELRSLIEYLARHNIQLALEARMLSGDGDCKDDGGNATLAAVQRLHQLGASLAYIAMDEPIFHWRSKSSCHASVKRVAANIGKTLEKIRFLFPGVQVGDIEPVGQWAGSERLIPDALELIDAYKITTGSDLVFFHADVGWDTSWLPMLIEFGHQLQKRHIKFGVIYNGSSLANSDAKWAQETESHFKMFEKAFGGIPDAAIFQSWAPYPTHALKESNPDALTGIVNTYLQYRRAD